MINGTPLKQKSPNKKVVNPWWNDQCTKALKSRKDALKDYTLNPSNQTHIENRKKTAAARKIFRLSKKNPFVHSAKLSLVRCQFPLSGKQFKKLLTILIVNEFVLPLTAVLPNNFLIFNHNLFLMINCHR